MDRDTALEIVRKQLTKRRYEHTVRVTDTALALAVTYGADREKTELAAALHDYAKFRPEEEMKHIIKEDDGIPDELLSYNLELWHAPVGAHLVEEEVGISDPAILGAIRYHTTGRAEMTLLEKVIFLADYIEPGRDFPGVDDVRKLAEHDLNAAIVQALSNTVIFLMGKKQKVHPDTMAAYNSLV
jgi:predicted HD superfamily hydrolase involved in NAD metabolism